MVKKFVISLFIIIFLVIHSFCQIPELITVALKNGNSVELANHFNKEIELIVIDNENVYSKSQAQVIVKEFFDKNSIEDFEIKHQGDKENMHYVIGNLITENKVFRISFILKTVNKKLLIHQLRIEDE